uniref:Uncharacterized protein n=1 Tax=Gasterosteus aculeatus TaxID=69293 RepID=G3PYT0_GASAC
MFFPYFTYLSFLYQFPEFIPEHCVVPKMTLFTKCNRPLSRSCAPVLTFICQLGTFFFSGLTFNATIRASDVQLNTERSPCCRCVCCFSLNPN